MNIHSTDSLAGCIDFVTTKTNEALPMAEELDPNESNDPKHGLAAAHKISDADRPFIVVNRMAEILRKVTAGDVGWFTLNHFHTLNTIFALENDFGIETQTLPKLIGIEKSTCNRILHSFADKGRTRSGLGFIEIRTDEFDGRIRRVFLTQKGRDVKEEMASAGTYSDNQSDLRALLQALDATRMQSMEKAVQHFEPQDITAGKPEVQNATVTVQGTAALGAVGSVKATAIKMSVDRGEMSVEGSKVYFKQIKALDRAMKEAENSWNAQDPSQPKTVRYGGKDVPTKTADEIRTADGTKYEIIQTAGYWMLYSIAALEKDETAGPSYIQRNLSVRNLAAYMNNLVMQINAGTELTDIMNQTQRWLNKTQYNYVRNKIVHDFAGTRTELMKQLEDVEASKAYAENRKRQHQDAADKNAAAHREYMDRGLQTPTWQMHDRLAFFNMASAAGKETRENLEKVLETEDQIEAQNQKMTEMQKQLDDMQKLLSQVTGVALEKDDED